MLTPSITSTWKFLPSGRKPWPIPSTGSASAFLHPDNRLHRHNKPAKTINILITTTATTATTAHRKCIETFCYLALCCSSSSSSSSNEFLLLLLLVLLLLFLLLLLLVILVSLFCFVLFCWTKRMFLVPCCRFIISKYSKWR